MGCEATTIGSSLWMGWELTNDLWCLEGQQLRGCQWLMTVTPSFTPQIDMTRKIRWIIFSRKKKPVLDILIRNQRALITPTQKGLHHRKIYWKIVCSGEKTSSRCRGEWHAIESVNSHQKSVSSYKRSRSVSPIYREPRGSYLRSKKATHVVPQ